MYRKDFSTSIVLSLAHDVIHIDRNNWVQCRDNECVTPAAGKTRQFVSVDSSDDTRTVRVNCGDRGWRGGRSATHLGSHTV